MRRARSLRSSFSPTRARRCSSASTIIHCSKYIDQMEGGKRETLNLSTFRNCSCRFPRAQTHTHAHAIAQSRFYFKSFKINCYTLHQFTKAPHDRESEKTKRKLLHFARPTNWSLSVLFFLVLEHTSVKAKKNYSLNYART